MINHSLGNLREDLKNIMINSISLVDSESGNVFLPIMYDNQVSPAIRNMYLEDEYFDRFLRKETTKRPIKGKIMTLIRDKFELDVNNMYFGVFTVINVTDSIEKAINNPPNPPYINLSKLIYNLPYSLGGMASDDNKQKAVDVYKELLETTNNYSYYRNNNTFRKEIDEEGLFYTQKDIPKTLDKVDFKNKVYEPHILKFIKLVQQNNPSTLIGSIEATDIIRSFTFDKIVGYFSETLNDQIHKKYNSIGLEYYNKDSKQVDVRYISESETLMKGKQLFTKLARPV